MGMPVLGPDVNESQFKFTVNDKGEIRFGLGGMKGVGEGAVRAIVEERRENGAYKNIFDMLKRIDLRAVNKKTLENLALGGAFDGFDNCPRSVYFYANGDEKTFLERAIRFAQNFKAQEESSQVSLFGGGQEVELPEPEIPVVEEWPRLMKLNKEKDVNGIYLSSHPLDDFKYEMKFICSHPLKAFEDLKNIGEYTIGGIITESRHLVSKQGKPFGFFTIEDYSGNYEFRLFGDDYLRVKPYIQNNLMVMINGFVNRFTPWQGAEERIEAKIKDVKLLPDVMEEMGKSVMLQLPLNEVKPEVIDDINALVEKYKGSKRLNLMIFDPEKPKVHVRMPRKGHGIHITSELLDELNTRDYWKVTLNA